MKLRKLLFPALAGVAVLFSMVACDNENEFHSVYFPVNPLGAQTLYADQEVDTIYLYSTDSWQASPVGGWFTITPTSLTMSATTLPLHKIVLTTTPNTSGSARNGSLQVSAHDNIQLGIYQTAVLHIIAPSGVVDEDNKPLFKQSIAATAGTAMMKFHVYKDGATLSTDSQWLMPFETTFNAGEHEVTLTAEANTSTQERTATFTLTSNGVSTNILYTQAGQTAE